MKSFIFALMALIVAPSLAMAGESNSKDDPQLTVRNGGNADALVIINPDLDELSDALDDSLSIEERFEAFEEAGGVRLEPRDSHSVDVKAGTQTVAYFFLDNGFPQGAESFTVRSNVRVREGIDATITIRNQVPVQ